VCEEETDLINQTIGKLCVCMCVCACVCACVCVPTTTRRDYTDNLCVCLVSTFVHSREVGGWGRVPFSKNLMSPTPRRKWYLTTERRAH